MATETIRFDAEDEVDSTIVRRARDGSKSACDVLFQAARSEVKRAIVRETGKQGEEVSDIANSAAATGLENIDEGKHRWWTWQSFLAWIKEIARNKGINRQRKERRHSTKLASAKERGEVKTDRSSEPSPEEFALERECEEVVLKAIRVLSPSAQEAFRLYHGEELDPIAIAKTLGLSVRRVQMLLTECKEASQRALRRAGYFDAK